MTGLRTARRRLEPADVPTGGDAASRARLGQLDGLRGLAVLAVILFHTSLFPGGFLGVDLFFALSGYVITAGLLRETRSSGRVELCTFLARRARRLLPALLVLIAVVLVAAAALGTTSVRHFAIADTPWALTQLVNWHFIADDIGYGQQSSVHVFAHLWSIAVEWQFYLLWPVVVGLTARLRHGERVLAIVTLAATGVSTALMASLGAVNAARAYEGTDTRAAALLLGAFAAMEPVRRVAAALSRHSASVLAVVLSAALLTTWVAADGTDALWLYRGGLLVHSALAAALIALLAAAPSIGMSRAIGSAIPRWLGRCSYGVYLWHWPIVVLLPHELSDDRLRFAIVLTLSVALGTLSTRLIEDPIRLRARWARGRSGALLAVVAVSGVMVLWLLVPRPDLGAGTVDVSRLR